MVTAGAGTTGGEDTNAHTHDMQGHTHDRLAHKHQTDLGWDGNLYLKVDSGSDPPDGSITETGTRFQLAATAFTYGTSDVMRLAQTRIDGSGNTSGPSNNTTTAASDTENRPAFYELVPLCKL
jgi:hypothetical protein